MPDPINYSFLLSELKQKESELLTELAGVRAAIVGISKARMIIEPSTGMLGSGEADRYKNLSIRRASIDFLRSSGESAGSTEIAKALFAGGYRSTSRALYRTVFNVLTKATKSRSAEIVKTEAGFGHKEWDAAKNGQPSGRKKPPKEIQGRIL